jgi:hypothetical protein
VFKPGIHKRVLIAAVLLPGLLSTVVRAASLDDELLVDPTAPLFADAAPVTAGGNLLPVLAGFVRYELSSILIREEDRVAVVNAQRVRVGDSIGSARVTAINPGSVTIRVDGEQQTLQLYRDSIKTLVKGDD